MERFAALGVVEQTTRHDMEEVDSFFEKIEGIFAKGDFTKAQVVEAIKEFIPNLTYGRACSRSTMLKYDLALYSLTRSL